MKRYYETQEDRIKRLRNVPEERPLIIRRHDEKRSDKQILRDAGYTDEDFVR